MRLAKPGEETEVVSLIAGFRDFYGEAEPDDEQIAHMVAELLGGQRAEFLLVGEPAVGVAQLRFRPSVWTGTEDAWLEDLFMVEDTRRAGAGRALVQGCVDRALARGCKRIQLDANERNDAAMALYESLGFSSSTSERFDGGRNLYLTRWI
ncbi:MAG TPA: GNAT family N-acetyltransferase [Solirubrobacterales bacterium]